MVNNHAPKPATDRYSYHRSSDGCDNTFLIEDTDGQCVLQLHFWDEPDTDEAAIAKAKAQMLVAALNLQGGGWVLPPYPHWTLYHDKQIAAIWGIEDVQELRPDLTADQASHASTGTPRPSTNQQKRTFTGRGNRAVLPGTQCNHVCVESRCGAVV